MGNDQEVEEKEVSVLFEVGTNVCYCVLFICITCIIIMMPDCWRGKSSGSESSGSVQEWQDVAVDDGGAL